MFPFVCCFRLRCECRFTTPGDELIAAGNHPRFGSWDPSSSMPLSTTPQMFPLWTTPTFLFIFSGMGLGFIEYKYAIRKRDGAIQWEPIAGNRCVEVGGGLEFVTNDIWGQRTNESLQNVRISLSSLLKHPDARGILILQKQIENAMEYEGTKGGDAVKGLAKKVLEEEADRVIKAEAREHSTADDKPLQMAGFTVTDLLSLLHSGQPISDLMTLSSAMSTAAPSRDDWAAKLQTLKQDEAPAGKPVFVEKGTSNESVDIIRPDQSISDLDIAPWRTVRVVPDQSPDVEDVETSVSIPLQDKSSAISYRPHREFRRQAFLLAHLCPIQEQYTLDNVIGRGTWGEVRVVQNKETKTQRAAKRIPKCYVEDCDRFRFEIDLVKSLDHPNIVRVYETFEDANDVYLVMELCAGEVLYPLSE